MTELVTELVERTHTGTMPAKLVSGRGNFNALATSRDKVTELWSLLEYYYAIEETRDKFLISKGITNKSERARVGIAFSSYIEQAKNFFTYAQNSDYRSAALLYYYSFLNLAKAKLVVEKPELVGKEFHHGIKRNNKTGDVLKQTCKATTSYKPELVATFSELYALRFDKALKPSMSVSLSNLLGYCTDVTHEYTQVNGSTPKISPVKYHVVIDNNRKKCWVKIAVCDWGRQSRYKGAYGQFLKEFKRITISNLNRQLTWDLSPHAMPWYTFFESDIEYDFIGTDGVNTFACNDQLKRILKNHFQDDIFDGAGGFQMTAPLRQNNQTPCDELTAIYIAMFHLSEIVRYEPEFFESVLSNKTKNGWLIKNFIESCPSTFLQRMIGWITGDQYLVERR